MPTVDEAVENITWAVGDSFLSDYLNEVLNEVFERVEEDGEDPEDVLDDVVTEWLDRSYIYDKVYDYLYEHIDDECMRTSDCMEIITDYGFSDSLAAAVDMGCDLSDADETVVACAVLHMNLPSTDDLQEEIVRQISESTDYREQLFEYEKAEVGDDEKYSADGGED
ncbi:MAG: hypothetical protein IJD66_01520 [Methanocorpusculum sp.]|nr:hypothetical protein [Methanocorpusculum sp.]